MTSRNKAKQSQETCPNVIAAYGRPRKGVQAAVGILLSEKDPVASLSSLRGSRGDGILSFTTKDISESDLCGSLCPCGETSPRTLNHRDTERHRAFTERIALVLAIVLCLVSLASCSRANRITQQAPTREITDEAGRRIRLPGKIDRIVSLAPNLTEIVYAVGAGDQLVGDTQYCDYPAAAKTVAKVGDTMHPSIERIIALKPQIVLVSTASQLEAFTKQLDQQNIAVFVTNPQSLDDVFRSIQTLGDLFAHHESTVRLVADLQARAAAVEKATSNAKSVKVFYQVSDSPLYTIGRAAYLTDLIRRAGGTSVTADVPGAFPRFSDEAALAAKPDAIILPTGGSMGSANSTVATALKNSPAVQNNRIYKINEDCLQRPGPRLVDGLEDMARALHPESFK